MVNVADFPLVAVEGLVLIFERCTKYLCRRMLVQWEGEMMAESIL
jgi:hypothetical protein